MLYETLYLAQERRMKSTLTSRDTSRIEELLSSNQRGMTISGIARKLGLSRNTVSRYLDIMFAKGSLEMRQIGSAKLYSLSHRVPITSLIDASSDIVAILNKDLVIVQGNDSLANLLGIHKMNVFGLSFRDNPLFSFDIELKIRQALLGVHSHSEVKLDTEKGLNYFSVVLLPINLGDGTSGVCMFATDITEKKLITEALKESEKKHRTIINAISDVIIILGKENKVDEVYISKYNTIPIQRADLIGKSVDEIVPPDICEKILENAERIRLLKEQSTIEFPIYDQDMVFWFSASLTLHEDNENVVVLVKDITRRREAELKLEASEKKFRTVFENAGVGMTIVDLDNHFIDVNPAYLEMVGYTRNEIFEKTWMEFTYPDDLEKEHALSNQMMRDRGNRFQYTKRYIRKDGHLIWIDMTVTVVRDFDGNPQSVISLISDTTEQHRLSMELTRSEEKFRNIFFESPVAINTFDSAGMFLHANQALLDLFGIENEDAVMGINIFEDPNLPDDIKERMRSAETIRVQNTIDFDRVRRSKFYETPKSGELITDTIIAPMGVDTDGSPSGFIVQVNDVTKQKHAERRLEELQESYRFILDSIVNGVIVHDAKDNITFINKKASEVLGLPEEHVLGTSLQTGFLQASMDAAMDEYTMAKKELKPVRFEEASIKSDSGRVSYVSGWIIPLIKDNSFGGMLVTFEDVSDLVEVKEKEQSNVKFLSSVINSLPHPFYVLNPTDYTISTANKAISDEDHDEELTCYRLTHQREQPCNGKDHSCPIKEIKRTKKPVTVQHVHTSQEGEVQYVEIHAVPMLDEEENILNIIEYCIDISEHKELEDRLRQTESRYRSLFENSPVSLWEEDFSQVKEFFDSLENEGVVDFRSHFETNADDLEKCIDLVMVLDVNKSSLDLYGVQEKGQLLGPLRRSFNKDGKEVFLEQIIALAEGRTLFQSSIVPLNVRGQRRNLAFQVSVPPGFEESLSRVYLSMTDLSAGTLYPAEDLEQTHRIRQLEKQVEDERLLRNIIERMTMSSSQEAAFQQFLSDVGTRLNVERVGIFCMDKETKRGSLRYEWCIRGKSKIANRLKNVNVRDFAWWLSHSDSGEPILISDSSLIPREGNAEKDILHLLGIKSFIAVPVFISLKSEGFIGVSDSKMREYSQYDASILRAFADIVSWYMESNEI